MIAELEAVVAATEQRWIRLTTSAGHAYYVATAALSKMLAGLRKAKLDVAIESDTADALALRYTARTRRGGGGLFTLRSTERLKRRQADVYDPASKTMVPAYEAWLDGDWIVFRLSYSAQYAREYAPGWTRLKRHHGLKLYEAVADVAIAEAA